MKVLHVSDNDLDSRRFNGKDLTQIIKKENVESKFLVWNKMSNHEDTLSMLHYFKKRETINQIYIRAENEIGLHSLFSPFSMSLLSEKFFLDADIIHYHLIHKHFFNITHLPILTKLKPTLWSLHDPWALTGHCIHPFDCEKWKTGCFECPNLNTDLPLPYDSAALNWEFKKVYFNASHMDLLVASKWMQAKVKNSPLFKDKEIHLIPFGINLDIFKPVTKVEARKHFKIPSDNFVISFRASNWKLKGLNFIKIFLDTIDGDRITLLTNDTIGLLDQFRKKFHIVDLGWINDDNILARMYSAADIYLMPSIAESFGLSAVEAMACGTPVLGFDGTALADIIFAPKGGIVVPQNNLSKFVEAFNTLKSDREKLQELSNNALALVRENYGHKLYAKRMAELYSCVIDKRKDLKEYFNLMTYLRNSASIGIRNGIKNIANGSNSVDYNDLSYDTFLKIKRNKYIRFVYYRILKPLARLYRNFKK